MPREMPAFTKSPPELIARFDAAAARHPAAERRKMFGYPALFVGGNLATGLFADRWMVRLRPADLETILTLPGAEPFSPMPGRGMKGYASLPQDVVGDDARLDEWVGRALAAAGDLPPK
jgi:TfoX/Sxy family transcriptional regulator of competence genes